MKIIKVKGYREFSPFQKISILAFAEPFFYLRKNERNITFGRKFQN